MPLSTPASRREVHWRLLDMKTYQRDDGLFDVEAHLVDRKPFVSDTMSGRAPVPAGQPRHDMWVRLTVDSGFVVRDVEAVSDVTPFGTCKEAAPTLGAIIGMKIASGWSMQVKDRLRGTASCTHLMEMLIPLATVALQGINGLNIAKRRAAVHADGTPIKIDTCFAYARSSPVVEMLWPAHYRPRSANVPDA